MASPPIFRNQSQKKICSDLLRMKNEQNKMIADPKPFRLQSAPDLSNQDSENHDPGNSVMVRKAPQQPGVSRLPVLAKSLRLQTPSDFSQSHCRWQEKPLAGKTKKKKTCTRLVPLNQSRPKSSRPSSENPQPLNVLRLQTGTHAVQHEKYLCNASLKTQNINSKTSQHLAVVSSTAGSTKGKPKTHGNGTDNTIHPSGQSGPHNTFKPSTTLSNPLSFLANNALHQNHASAQPSVIADNSFTNTDLVRVKHPTKTSHAEQKPQLTTQGTFSKGSTCKLDKGENFQSDHAALLTYLRNEGISATGLASKTPQSKTYNYLPQRMSIMKSQQIAGRVTASVKSVQFSPDPAALQSILQNEGIKAAGPMGATPRNSVCPLARDTSIYTPQRVPVRKNCAEPTARPVALAIKDISSNKWTPQRVQGTRHQPMSAMKWHQLKQRSPCMGTPGLRRCKTDFQPSQEEVVQKLFDDQEDEQSTNVTETNSETQAEHLPADQTSAPTACCKETIGTSRANTSKDEEKEQEHTTMGGQPFFQAPGRESVIYFSTGKKLFRAPCFEKQESSSHQNQCGPNSSEQTTRSKLPGEILSMGGSTCQMKPVVHSLHRELILHKSCSLSPAVALLRKRFPPLEELCMDDEVATYTSMPVSAAPGFLPPRPRCGNPLAATLHFEESTTFVPIAFDLSSGPSSPLSLILQE